MCLCPEATSKGFPLLFRDWSLNTGRGGGRLQSGRGRACEVLPLRKWGWGGGGRAEKVLAMLKVGGGGGGGGHKQVLG